MYIHEEIGIPALLEHCAEECGELAHACLKLARKMRGENPTPMKKEDIFNHLNDESADVQICMEALCKAGVLSKEEINRNRIVKMSRFKERIAEAHKKKEENKNG